MTGGKKETFYRVTYRDPKNGEIQEIKAKKIQDSTLGLSFVAISDFLFDTNSSIVKPSEEHLAKRFENVRSLHLQIYSIVSIEEVGLEHRGLKFKKDKSNLVVLPNANSEGGPQGSNPKS